jgi:hypothetical protein
MKMLNEKTMQLSLKEARKMFKIDIQKKLSINGKKNAENLLDKIKNKRTGYIVVIKENTEIIGFLIWLQYIVKKFKVCTPLLIGKQMSFYYCKD